MKRWTSLAAVLMIDVLGYGAGAATEIAAADAAGVNGAASGRASTVPQRLLGSLLGSGLLRDMGVKVRADLRSRLRLLFEEEMLRFAQLADAVGVPDEEAAVLLRQATYVLESAR